MEVACFCRISMFSQNFVDVSAEFGKICRTKLWSLLIICIDNLIYCWCMVSLYIFAFLCILYVFLKCCDDTNLWFDHWSFLLNKCDLILCYRLTVIGNWMIMLHLKVHFVCHIYRLDWYYCRNKVKVVSWSDGEKVLNVYNNNIDFPFLSLTECYLSVSELHKHSNSEQPTTAQWLQFMFSIENLQSR